MLQTIRDYALERLSAEDAPAEIRRRQAQATSQLLAELVGDLAGPRQGQAIEHYDEERANAREAISFALESGDAELALALAAPIADFGNFLGSSSHEERDWVDRALALARGRTDALLLRVLHGRALMAFMAADGEGAKALATRTLEIGRTSAEGQRMIGSALNTLAVIATEEQQYDRAEPLYREAVQAFERAGFERGSLAARMNLASIALYRRDFETAETAFREGLEVQRRNEDLEGAGHTLGNLAMVALYQDRLEQAQRHLHEASELVRAAGARSWNVYLLEIAAALAARAGQFQRVPVLLGAAGVAAAELDVHLETFEQQMHDETEARARGELGDGHFDELAREGRALERAVALKLALSPLDPAVVERRSG